MTPECPLRCRYCYNVWKAPGAAPADPAPLDVRAVAEAVAGARPSTVTLTGGEPLLVEDLPHLAAFLSSRGILTGVATSGLLLDRRKAEDLVRSGVRRFEIHLPAADPEAYRRSAGVDGFTRAKAAMLAVVASGAGLTVSHVMTGGNRGEVSGVIELAFALGAGAVALNRFVPGGEGLRHAEELTPTPEELPRILSEAGEAARRFPVPVHVTIPVEDCLLPHDRHPGLNFTGCRCGREKWAVDPRGGLRTCEQNPEVLGSLLDRSFADLADLPAARRFRGAVRFPACEGCSAFPDCGGGCRIAHSGTAASPPATREGMVSSPGLQTRQSRPTDTTPPARER